MAQPLSEWVAVAGPHAATAALGGVRVLCCLGWLPFASSGTLVSRLLRPVLALWIVLGLWPVVSAGMPHLDWQELFSAAVREALIGSVLGLALALPFHALHAAGSIIDNQRGANIGSMLDPTSGAEASELARLLELFGVAVFLETEGLRVVLDAILGSYRMLDATGSFLLDAEALTRYIGTVLAMGTRLAAPVIVGLFIAEAVLGVLSRFAQQLNAFSLSLAIKTAAAFLILITYLIGRVYAECSTWWRQVDAQGLIVRMSP